MNKATFTLQSWALLIIESLLKLKHNCLCIKENATVRRKRLIILRNTWQPLLLGLNTNMRDFLQGHVDFTFFVKWHKLTNSHSSLIRRKPSLTYANILGPVLPHFQALSGCSECTRSDILLVLYRDTPVPTVAMVRAMGLMRLLCCIRTSPEICLCRKDSQDWCTHS